MRRRRRHAEPSAWSTSCLPSTFSFGWVYTLARLSHLHLLSDGTSNPSALFPRCEPVGLAVANWVCHYLWNVLFRVKKVFFLFCFVVEIMCSGSVEMWRHGWTAALSPVDQTLKSLEDKINDGMKIVSHPHRPLKALPKLSWKAFQLFWSQMVLSTVHTKTTHLSLS